MKPKCPECESQQVLYRVKSKSYICRVCGKEWAKDVSKKPKTT